MEYNESNNFGDLPDEYGNVVCDNCGHLNDLSTGVKEIECENCHKIIDTTWGKVIRDLDENGE